MTAQFKIIEVLNTKVGSNNQGLVFKVQWIDSNQIAYMQFDMAKRKYPLVVLDYLASRIKKKQIPHVICETDNTTKKQAISDITRISDINLMGSHELKQIKQRSPIDKFFYNCFKCSSIPSSTKIFDCDSIIPLEFNLAYAVFFKLPKNKSKSFKKIRNDLKHNTNTQISQI